MSSLNPTTCGERAELLDIFRGFAVFGILLMNIEFFQRPLIALSAGFNHDQALPDYITAWLSYFFVQGKFYTIFSILFGIGFVLFLERAMSKTSRPRLLFCRRITILATFGLVHACFIWAGDILFSYAIAGFILLFFLNSPVSRLWKWSLVLIILPTFLIWYIAWQVEAILATEPERVIAWGEMIQQDYYALVAERDLIYAQGTFIDVVKLRFTEFYQIYFTQLDVIFTLSIVGYMLIGVIFARLNWWSNPAEHFPAIKKLFGICLAIGIPTTLLLSTWGIAATHWYPTFKTIAYVYLKHIGELTLAFSYLCIFAILYVRGKQWIHVFAPVGRMALTNYIFQSLFFTSLFYGYGFGLYGEYGRLAITLMAIAVFILQVLASHWWMQRFKFGPLEWLWRSLTYLKRQPFKRA